jgi:RHS repeat-associated protein
LLIEWASILLIENKKIMPISQRARKASTSFLSFVVLCCALSVAPLASALTAQTITGFAPATPVLFSGGTFTLSATGGASGNPVVFSSGTTTICTVSGSIVTKVAVGTCTLRANQAGNATYSAAPQVSKNVVINKGTQTITFAAIPGKGFGIAPFTVPVTASSSLGVALTSTTTPVCTVSGSTVTIVALGTCTLAANQAGNTNYNAAAQVTQPFTVAKGAQTITFAALTAKTLGAAPFTISATASSGLAVAFTSTTTAVCTVAGTTVTLVSAGTCTLAANQAGNTNYNAATQITQSFTVSAAAKTNQTITFNAIASTALGTPLTLTGITATSGLAVTMTSATTTICTVSGFTVTLVTTGTCTLRADQAGNASFNAAPQVSQSFTVLAAPVKTNQTITFGAIANTTLGTPLTLTGITATSGLAVAMTSATTTICTVSGFTVTLVAQGTCTLRANQAGNASFNAAPQVSQSFTVLAAPVRTNQTITFAAIANTALGTPLTLTGITATSGLAVAMTSATTTICTISGFTVTLVAQGTCTLRANQAGNASFNAAPQISQSFTVLANNKTNQTITFDALKNDSIYWGGGAAGNIGTTSGLAVVTTSATPTVCTVGPDPNTPGGFYITYLTQGTCTIRANQPGDATYNPAPQVSRSFTIQPPYVAISITSPTKNASFNPPANVPMVVSTSVFGPEALSEITYYRDGVLVGKTLPNTPFTHSNLGIGTYTLYAVAQSGTLGGNRYSAQSQSITVTVVPPVYTVTLTSPANGSTYMAPATISLAATATPTAPATSISRVDFYRGTTLIGTSTTAPFNFVWTGAPAGGYRLTAVATDNLGVARTSAVVYAVVDSADTCINAPPLASAESATKLATLGQLPITFEENIGQTNPAVRFQARTPGFQLFLTENERVMVAQSQAASVLPAKRDRAPVMDTRADTQARSVAVRMSYIGANPHPVMTGTELSEQRSHYLVGDDANQSHTDIRHFAKAQYNGIYPGIDEVYYGKEGKLEYDLRVAPGADPNVIRVAFKDVESVTVDESGDLLLSTPLGILVQKKPVAYQDINGERHEVVASYKVDAANEVSFAVGNYDAAHTLIIDPVVLYSTLVGGSNGYSGAYSIAVSRCGEAYIAGVTQTTDFPTTPGALDIVGNATLAAGRYVGFVSKLNPAGTALMYSTYIGGTNKADSASTTLPYNVVLDPTGHAYVAGYTTDPFFPTTPGSVYNTSQAQTSPFVAKLNNAGNALVYATYLPDDTGAALAVDAAGAAYVAGVNQVYKINPSGRSIDYKMPVGYAGPNPTISQVDPKTLSNATAIAVDATGHAYVAGTVAYDLAVTPGAFQTVKPSTYIGSRGRSGFVSKINPAGNGFIYSTYLGNTSDTLAYSITVDATGNAYIAGQAQSINAPPNYLGAVNVFNNNGNLYTFEYGFAAKLNAAGSQLDYYSLIGGAECGSLTCGFASTTVGAIKVDSLGGAWITGTSTSNQIPSVNALPSLAGGNDFAAKLDPTGANLIFATPLGVGGSASSVAIDSAGSVYIAGVTSNPNFPTTANAFQRTLSAGATYSAFVLKINESRDTFTSMYAQPRTTTVGNTVTLTATVTGNSPVGTVTFMSGTTVIGTSTLTNGTATFASALAGGFYQIRAEYSGSPNHLPSVSKFPESVTVTSPDVLPTVTLTSNIAHGAILTANAGDTYTGANLTVDANAGPGNRLKLVSINIDNNFTPFIYTGSVFSNTQVLPAFSVGVHNIYGEALNNFDRSARSAPLRFVVNAVGATPPTVAIIAPANGTTIPSTAPFTITAAVTPAAGKTISQVYFYAGTNYIGSSGVAPYTADWSGSAGTHNITAIAVDSAQGHSISAPITVVVNPLLGPLLAPSLTPLTSEPRSARFLVFPLASTGGSAIVSYTATCSAPGIPDVIATAFAASNDATTGTTILVPGLTSLFYSCYVIARNSTGPGPASSNLFIVPNPAFDAPSELVITGTASTLDSVTMTFSIPTSAGSSPIDGYGMQCYAVGQSAAAASAPISASSITITGLARDVTYSCYAAARNAQGFGFPGQRNITTARPSVSATVNITAPTNNATYNTPAAVVIAASATAAPGTSIQQVEILAGTLSLATLTSAPYTSTWSPAYAGSHALTARVTDNNGVVTTSAAVNITVTSAQSPTLSLTSPTANASYATPATIPLAATATPAAGTTITKIEVYSGATLIATSNGSTLNTTWITLKPGTQSLTARAIDSNGGISTASVTITVTSAANETITFIHNDLAGSPMAATDINGAIVWKEDYTPYGERKQNEAAASNQHQWFGGKVQDSETGLSYFGARYYDPVVGRFMGVDAVGFNPGNLQSFNRYAYANNNPYRFVDPDGNEPESVMTAWVAHRTREPAVACMMGCHGIPYAKAEMMNEFQAFILNTASDALVIGATGGLSRMVGAVVEGATAAESSVRVGRWMSNAEFSAMKESRLVQESFSGTTHVASPAEATTFMNQAKSGSMYVEFNVPSASVKSTSDGVAKILGPSTTEGRLAARKGQAIPQMPAATDIVHSATKVQ